MNVETEEGGEMINRRFFSLRQTNYKGLRKIAEKGRNDKGRKTAGRKSMNPYFRYGY